MPTLLQKGFYKKQRSRFTEVKAQPGEAEQRKERLYFNSTDLFAVFADMGNKRRHRKQAIYQYYDGKYNYPESDVK